MKSYLKLIIIFIFSIVLISCDGGIYVKIYTYENSTIEGVFYQDTLLIGTAVPNTDLKIYYAAKDSYLSSSLSHEYKIQTDNSGKFEAAFTVPPMKTRRDFHGFIIAEKDGYVTSVLPFRHSSLDSIMCIINMKRRE